MHKKLAMEQKVGRFQTGQQKNSEHISYNYVDNRNDGLDTVDQRFNQSPHTSMNMNLRPSDTNMASGARPVLNYSIQTGEEFALEFIWERVNPRLQYKPISSVGSSSGTVSAEVHVALEAAHTGSGRVPNSSSFPSVKKCEIQDPVNNGSLILEKPLQPVARSRTSAKGTTGHMSQTHSSLGSFGVSTRILKLLCSFGGKILPRPSDRKLRYVGGETRILCISRDISWEQLKQKTLTLYNDPHSIKYQLPDEELDALISVSSDEDLQHMMDECNALDDGGSQKLRMFLISTSDLDDSQLGFERIKDESDIQFIVAINGLDFGSRRISIGVESKLGNNLNELLSLSVKGKTGEAAVSLAACSTAHPEVVSPSPNESSQIQLPSTSHALEATPLG